MIVPRSLAAHSIPAVINEHQQSPRVGMLSTPIWVGAALALAFAGGGVWLIRGRRSAALLVVALTLIGFGGTLLLANMTPPRSVKKAYPEGLPVEGVAVEFVDEGNSIRLLLPRPVAADLAEKLNATEPLH